MDMFVIVNTYGHPTIGGVGAVYGPFLSKAKATSVRDELNFPNPELALIRAVHNVEEWAANV